jgi:phage terminase large subunit
VEKIKSIANITDIWCEEATELFADDFSQLDLRLRHPSAQGQQFILSFNPISKVNWCYQSFFSCDFETDEELEEALKFRKNVRIIHTTYKDNRFLPEQYTKTLEALKFNNPAYYSIYCLGEFGSLGRLVYKEPTILSTVEINKKRVGVPTYCGNDFGFTNDANATVFASVDTREKKIYIYDEIYEIGLTNDAIAERLKEHHWNGVVICDSAEPKSIEELRRLGVKAKPAVKGKDSILQGIQLLQQYEIFIDSKCKNTIEEFRNYEWEKDKKTNEYINKPIDKWNHSLDALRYLIQEAVGKGHLKSMPKQMIGL